MRLFLFQWPDNVPEYVEAIKELEKKGHEISYWVYALGDSGNLKAIFPKIILQSHADALNNIFPKEMGDFVYDPPTPQLIEKMHGAESMILSMMNKRYDSIGTEERKRIYYSILGYWSKILRKFSPDLIVFISVPHSVYDYLVYELSKLLNIRTLMFDETLIGNRLLYMNDFRLGSQKLAAAIRRNESREISLYDLSKDSQDYYKLQTDSIFDSTPSYVKADRKKFSSFNLLALKLKIILTSIRDLSFFRKMVDYFFKFSGQNLNKEYEEVQVGVPDYSKPFVYFPLNYQPECSTSPQGDIFVDLILAIETLSAALPSGWLIYVKEHPTQLLMRGINYSSSRYQGYYKKIAKIKNTFMIPAKTNSYELINKAKVTVSVTGTAVLEAAFRLKPAMIFGHPWYQNLPSLFRVNDVESCKKSFTKIIKGFNASSQQIINYLKSFEEATIPCYFDQVVGKTSKITRRESAQNALGIVLEELKYINN